MEQNYIVATASTADRTREYLEEHKIPFISYNYVLGDESFEDDCLDSTRDEVYKKMRNGQILTTSAINTYSYREFFEGLIKQGKDVVFLDMTWKISASYKFCDEAIAELKEEYPDRRIINVDTRCVSGGLGLLVEKVIELYEAGESMQTVLDWIEENKLKIAHRFTVDDLTWLKRGGRVSNASALIGTLLSIKPVLYVDNEGALVAISKARGRKKALAEIIAGVISDIKNPDGMVIRINHADCLEDAEFVKEQILATYPSIKEISINNLGVVIGAHTGPGLLAVFYMTDERKKD
ncbi:EDD domain protein, DegV family [Lachnospiraceae bacterium G11]|jgi:DegV family protein with EDD domain|nr:EDD domain protein, DegV family [Lachnospiraceae bacterium G11]